MCFHPHAASDARGPEAAVLARSNRPFDLCPVVVRLSQHRLFQLHIVGVFLNSILDSVLDVKWIGGVSPVIRGHRHDAVFETVVVPSEHIKRRVAKEPDRLLDGARVLCGAPRRLLIDLLFLE